MENNKTKNKAEDENTHAAIIGILVELSAGVKTLHQLIHELSANLQLRATSCVYKRETESAGGSSSSELICCLRTATKLSPVEILQFFKKISLKHINSRLLLLAFDQTVLMLPEQTLPHPRLATDVVLLRCAGEVWGDYEHPILAQTLNQLVDSSASSEKVEFFSQG